MADKTPGRRVWYQFWDTNITFRDSYYARVNYVIQNPVRHGLVTDAKHYKWCSARWFAETSTKGYYRTVLSYKTDQLDIEDDF